MKFTVEKSDNTIRLKDLKPGDVFAYTYSRKIFPYKIFPYILTSEKNTMDNRVFTVSLESGNGSWASPNERVIPLEGEGCFTYTDDSED